MTKLIPFLFFTALVAAIPASANPVTIELTGTSGVSDGADYVLPYFLSINGGTPISAACYDFFDAAFVGETWTANELNLSEAVTSGQYASDPNALEDYEMVGVLSTLTTVSAQDQIDLQHDLWNVFDPGTFTLDAGMSVYVAAATAELPTFNFANTRYLEGVIPGDQAFVFSGGDTLRFPDSPEPASLLLIGIGLLAIPALSRRSL